MDIRPCQTDAEIRACFETMRELRPQLAGADDFVARVRRQMSAHGYRLAAAVADGEVVAVTGFRVAEYLAWGHTLYVDDLVTRSGQRKSGHGGALLDWLIAQAQEHGCAQLHLDSGVQRHDAHRLYLGRKLAITSHHFALALD